MAGWRILAGRVNGFSRDGLGRVHFGGFGRDPSGRTGQQVRTGRVGNGTGRRVKFSFSKIPKNSKIVITVQ
jgi:hypothetical protein